MRAAYISEGAVKFIRRSRENVESQVQVAAGRSGLCGHLVGARLPRRPLFRAFVYSKTPGALTPKKLEALTALLKREFEVVEVEKLADQTQAWLRVGFEGTV